MVVELLRFRMRPEERPEFVARNERVWAAALRGRPGYRGHRVLLDREEAGEVVVLVHWRSAADMAAFPSGLERELNHRMGGLGSRTERRVYDLAAGDGPAG